MSLRIVPCDLDDANATVKAWHRHHDPVTGHKFSLAAVDETNTPRGVAIVGRPVSRMLQDGWTAEVTRVATDGARNGCSILYAAAWRVAKAMGFRRLFSYTLESEPGASLKALKDMGWRLDKTDAGGGSWQRVNQPKHSKAAHYPTVAKKRWVIGDDPPFPPRPVFPQNVTPQLVMELSA